MFGNNSLLYLHTYMCSMSKKHIKIYHQFMNFDSDESTRFLILIEIKGNRPVKSYVEELPADFLFYDEKYPYYIVYSN